MLLRGKGVGATDCPADVEEIHCASCWKVWARQAQLPLGKAVEAPPAWLHLALLPSKGPARLRPGSNCAWHRWTLARTTGRQREGSAHSPCPQGSPPLSGSLMPLVEGSSRKEDWQVLYSKRGQKRLWLPLMTPVPPGHYQGCLSLCRIISRSSSFSICESLPVSLHPS